MQRNHRFLSAAMAVAVLGTTLVAPMTAQASEEGKKNTTLGLGAAAALLLLTQKNKLPGVLAAGGAIYAGTQWQRDINHRHARERASAYRTGYHRGYSSASYHRRHKKVRHTHH